MKEFLSFGGQEKGNFPDFSFILLVLKNLMEC